MGEHFEKLKNALKKLPGLGHRSAERIALHLTVENPSAAREFLRTLSEALESVTPCPLCKGVSENGELCSICADSSRANGALCVVERASDIAAIERSGAWRGRYHVLGGKLSPLRKIGPEALNLASLEERLSGDENIGEIILALSNDIEAEATCHYIQTKIVADKPVGITRIGFGLPSGSQLGFADPTTIKSALEARRKLS